MSEKILSVAIPSYNSQDYMEHAVMSAVLAGDMVEVLIVDDGSTDNTASIGKRLEAQYPMQVRYIYKENGGHGDAVMTGLQNATGVYYKVLDSDDWLDEAGLRRVVSFLAEQSAKGICYDMFLSNYVYEKVGEKRKVSVSYENVIPVEREFTWDEAGKFKTGQYILMHSVIYRTALLRDCGLTLPKHTFYVDNIYVYYPLPYVKSMYYMNVDLYHYFIGRDDQSVNEAVMITRIDQQIRVTKLMMNMYELAEIENPQLRQYMTQYLTIMFTVCSALLTKDGTPESLEKKEQLWHELQEEHASQYEMIHKQFLGKVMKKDSKAWNEIIKKGYSLAQKLYHFN